MELIELLEILDEHVELIVYDKQGVHIMHFYDKIKNKNEDKDYFYWSKEFLKKKVIKLKPYIDFDIVKNYSLPPASLAIYLEDFYDTNDLEEEV